MIQDTHTGSGKFTLAPSSLPPFPAFFIAFPTAAKRSLKKEMISCSKQPQTFSLHPSMVLSTCVSHLLYYLPAARFQNTRIFFIKFYFIWTYQERFEHNSEISRKKLAVIFAMLTCLLWNFVNFFFILNTTAVIRNVNVTSGIVCVQSGWQLPVDLAVLDLIVYLSKGITILQTKQRYREVTNINIS